MHMYLSGHVSVKRRLAFLDLLTEAHDSGTKPLSDEGLRDEVNTFIFAVRGKHP